jgi:1,4-dihydroxy-2-naphthoate octaprenyltransferase
LKQLVAFVKLGRPLFLGGGFILFALGAAVAHWTGWPIDWHRYALGQGAVTAFQLMTHYANDYFDYAADVANATPTRWSGGSRVLVDGVLQPRVALIAALAAMAIGVAISTQLLSEVPILIAIVALSWFYSAPPLRLCARGLGEVTTAIVVTALVPMLAFRLQGGEHPRALIAAFVPLMLLQMAMLIAIEIPDAESDGATGKRTLVVREGLAESAKLYVAITVLAYLWLPVAWALGVPLRVVGGAMITAPVALWRVRRGIVDPSSYEKSTFAAVALLVATSAAELIAFLM